MKKNYGKTKNQILKKRYGIECVPYKDGILVHEEVLTKIALKNIKFPKSGLNVYVEHYPVKLSLFTLNGLKAVKGYVLLTRPKYVKPSVLDDFAEDFGFEKDEAKLMWQQLKGQMTLAEHIWTQAFKDKVGSAFYKKFGNEVNLLCPMFQVSYDDFDWQTDKEDVPKSYNLIWQKAGALYEDLLTYHDWIEENGLERDKITESDLNRFRNEKETKYL